MPRKGQFTKENAHEMGLKGAKKSAENAKKRKTAREDLKYLLKLSLKAGDLVGAEDIKNLAETKNMNVSVQTAIDIAMIQRAIYGDVQAAIWVRDTVGDKPTDKVELDQSLTVEEWAKTRKVKL